jgi:hypothetical protein
MQEILPGIHHWTAVHEGIGAPVSSYYVESAAAVIDPMVPEEGLDWFDGKPLDRVVIANRHHYRQADQFAERFGIPVLANEKGLHELEGRPGVQAFSFGDEVAPGIVAQSFEDSWPDEGVLVLSGANAIVLADGVMRYGGSISFVPDEHLGEDPEEEKAVLRAAVRRLLDSGVEFDAVLVGHGDPITSGGKAELEGLAAG